MKMKYLTSFSKYIFENHQFNQLKVLQALLEDWIEGVFPGGPSHYQKRLNQKIIAEVKKNPQIQQDSVNSVRTFPFLYRGLQINHPDEFVVSKTEDLNSFSIDRKVAEEFADGGLIIEMPINEILPHVLINVSIVFQNAQDLVGNSEGNFAQYIIDQKEIICTGGYSVKHEYFQK